MAEAVAASGTQAPYLVMSGVGVAYGGAFAVQDVTIELPRTGSLGIVGPNGAGKSSILNCLMGVVPCGRGTIVVDGKDVTRMPTWRRARRGVALVPDGGAVFGDLTVETNLDIASRESGAAKRARLESMYEAFPRLRERRKVAGGSLSGGEQRMLAVARALMRGPDLLVLDEVTVGLSWAMVEHVARLLTAEREQRALTMVVAGEDLTFIRQVCDQVAFVDHGRLTAARPVADLDDPDMVARMYFGGATEQVAP
jgi:branched-chain amino acid transport system ATP-binding protein